MRFVTVATFSYLYEADIARSKLEAHGIKALIPDEHKSNFSMFNAFPGIRLQVTEVDVSKAETILSLKDNSSD